MVVPDKGLTHDIQLLVKQHKDRDLAGGESQRPEPVIEEDNWSRLVMDTTAPPGFSAVTGYSMCTS